MDASARNKSKRNEKDKSKKLEGKDLRRDKKWRTSPPRFRRREVGAVGCQVLVSEVLKEGSGGRVRFLYLFNPKKSARHGWRQVICYMTLVLSFRHAP